MKNHNFGPCRVAVWQNSSLNCIIYCRQMEINWSLSVLLCSAYLYTRRNKEKTKDTIHSIILPFCNNITNDIWTKHCPIQINLPTRCNNFTSLLLDVYVWLNMFRAPLRPSSGAHNCTRSLRFYRWSVVGRGRGLPDHDHDQQHSNHHTPTVEPEAPNAVVCAWLWAERRLKHGEPHINVK